LPDLRIEHLRALTDGVGLFQHARYGLPNYSEGYCLDDNARALMFTVECDHGRGPRELFALETVYAAFVNHAFDAHSGCFRNFMAFDRRWLEPRGSADSHGRALWALGTAAQRATRRELRGWAAELFQQALPASAATDSPRAWAFTLLGLSEYLTRFA